MQFNIGEILKKYGDNTAFVCGETCLTYSELAVRAQKLAAVLKTYKGDTAIISGGRSAQSFIAIIACLLAKKAYLPIDISLPKERKDKIVSLSNASVLVECTGAEPVLKALPSADVAAKENENAYIIFTSGSTGTPKGVPISYGNLDNFISWISNLAPLSKFEHASVLSQASYSFDLSTASIYYALAGGHTLVQIQDGADVSAIFAAMQQNKTDIVVATPTFVRMLLLSKEFTAANFPFLKCIYFCGEPLQKSLCKAIFERFGEISIINAYGPTEATSAVCAIEITPDMLESEALLPVGKLSTAACDISAVNGELVIKGKSVFAGYLGKAQNFAENGYKTGDLGWIENGKIYCKGRADAQIKYKGYRIELGDIEENISAVSGVCTCAAVAKRTPEGEVKLIKAYYSGNIEEAALRAEIQKKLPEYMLPKTVKKLPDIPVNRNGKIDRKKLETL